MYMNDTQVFTKVKQDNDDNNNNWYNDLEVCVAENIYCLSS